MMDGGKIIILCGSLAGFARAHLHALDQGVASLLLGGRRWDLAKTLAADDPSLVVLSDEADANPFPALKAVAVDTIPVPAKLTDRSLSADQPVAVMFTSGTTGQPKAVEKNWGTLAGEAVAAGLALGLHHGDGVRFVVTVPVEHMYGYMFGFFLPHWLGLSTADRQVVFPADMQAALAGNAGVPAWVVTTPTHLRAICQSELRPPPGSVAGVLCATSPLPANLAARAREFFGAPVSEIYGSTETGAVALRDWGESEPTWRCLPGISLAPLDGGGFAACAAHYSEPIALADHVLPLEGGGFALAGRMDDVIKVAGKRASLGTLDQLLRSAPGVADGAYFIPPGQASATIRPAAFVTLHPTASVHEVRRYLAERVEPVFVPRPLIEVANLPRTGTGKIARNALADLYMTLCRQQQDQHTEMDRGEGSC